jgi:PAS domain S-box-containing protein
MAENTKKLLEILIVAAVYFITARIGQLLAIPPGNVTPVWLPSGIILAWALVRGSYIWPGVFLGAFAGNAWAYFDPTSTSIMMRSIFAGTANGIGDTFAIVGAAWAIKRLTGTKNPFNKTIHVSWFLIIGVVLGSLLSALFGVTGLVLTGFLPPEATIYTMMTWWTGDSMGAALIAPFLIVVTIQEKKIRSWNRRSETLINAGLLLIVTIFGLFMIPGKLPLGLFLVFIIPAFIWSIHRLEKWYIFLSLFITATLSILATYFGYGPFADEELNASLIQLQTFIGSLSLTVFYLNSITCELKASHDQLENRIKDRTSELEIEIDERKEEVKLRKLSEEKLQKSEQRFSLAMQGSNDGLWDWNLETDEVYFSPRWKDMLGYVRDEIRGHPDEWKALLHPEDCEQALQAVDDCMKGKTDRYEIEFRMRHKLGDFIPILSRGFMIYDDTNKPVRFVGTHVDITDIKQSEYNLKQSQTRLQLAMDAVAAGVWNWEAKTGEVFWDERMQEIFGLEPGSFDGTYEGWKACVHPDDLDAANLATLHALKHKDHYEHEYRVRGRDGGWRYVDSQAEVILDDQGQPVRMVGMATDITKRKRVEKELNASERKSRAWLESSPACTKIVDLDLNLQYMSNAGVVGLGISDVKTLYGKPYPFDFYPESFKKTMIKNLKKAIETGEVIEQEAAVVDVDGVELWFHSTLVPVTDDEGTIDYIIVVSIETTKRKQSK